MYLNYQKELQHALHPFKLSFTFGYRKYIPTLCTLITLFPYFLSETWSAPTVSGTIPPPCSFFSLTMINNHQAVLFGGFQGGVPSSDVYVLDLAQMVS
jgi:hypothetical protein